MVIVIPAWRYYYDTNACSMAMTIPYGRTDRQQEVCGRCFFAGLFTRPRHRPVRSRVILVPDGANPDPRQLITGIHHPDNRPNRTVQAPKSGTRSRAIILPCYHHHHQVGQDGSGWSSGPGVPDIWPTACAGGQWPANGIAGQKTKYVASS